MRLARCNRLLKKNLLGPLWSGRRREFAHRSSGWARHRKLLLETLEQRAMLATLVIVNDTVPTDPQDFAYTTTGGLNPANFSLDDDADGTLSKFQIYTNVVPGDYTVTRMPVGGFALTSLICSDQESETTTDISTGTASIDLDDGETVVCTFKNTKQETPGTIVIVKDTLPDDPQDFAYTTGGGLSPAGFALDDDDDATLSNIQTYNNVTPGAYTVAEGAVTGFALTSLTCDDPDDGTTANLATGTASIDLDAGETITCTFQNTKLGKIVIVKDTVPDDAQDFAFTTSGGLSPANFSLDDDVDGTLINTQTYDHVMPGAYTVTEPAVEGFARTSLTCDDPDDGSTTTLATGTASIDLDPGETITCTFENTKLGTIVIIKDTLPDDPQDFAFTTTSGLSPASFNLDDDDNATLSNTQTYNGVTPGAYTVVETPVAGFELIGLTCDDPDDGTTTTLATGTAAIDLDAGETITCTFENTNLGTIVIIKDTLPNHAQDFAFATTGGLSPANFNLDDDDDAALSNVQTYDNVTPGAYMVTEAAVGGFELTSLTCVDPDEGTTTDLAEGMAAIDLDAGETITCTFENTKLGSIVILKDTTPNDPQDFEFTTSGGLSPANFSLDDDNDTTLSSIQIYRNVTPGIYTVAEAAVTGFELTSLTCIDQNGGTTTSSSTRSAAIDMSAGETVFCIFQNTKLGKIVIAKDTLPDDPQDFAFATTGGLSPTNFNLDDDDDATLSNTQTYDNVTPGAYTVTEQAEAGFERTSLVCADPDDGTTTTLATGTAAIDLDPGETITCTFQNTKLGKIVIIKDTLPDDPQDFEFATTGGLSPANFNLDDDNDATLSNTQTYDNVTPGAYTVIEQAEAGFERTSLVCADPDDGTTTTLATGTASIDLDPGETITCTFQNTKQNSSVGNIVIVKDTLPDDAQDFSYATTGGLSPANFSLDDDADATLSNTQIYSNVFAGSYTIAEAAVTGFKLTDVKCVDPDGGTTTDADSGTVTIDLDADETITCTFENTKLGTLVIVKDTVPDHAQDFAYSTTGGLSPANFSLDDDADPTLPNTQTYTNVDPGSYTVSETAVVGFATTVSCSDPTGTITSGATASIDLDAGETVKCTYTNTAEPPVITAVSTSAPLEEKAVPGQAITVTAKFTDTKFGETHTATIDWDDGTVTPGIVDELTGTVTGTHQYSTGGVFAIAVTVIDSVGQSDTQTATAFVTGVRLTDDGDLQIVGTDTNDALDLELRPDDDSEDAQQIKVVARFDVPDDSDGGSDGDPDPEIFRYDASKVHQITAYLCDGDDEFEMDRTDGGSHRDKDDGDKDSDKRSDEESDSARSDGDSDGRIDIDAIVHGGDGDDTIRTGAGDDVVFGDDGHDKVYGNDGNDALVGGDDEDSLDGGDGRDLLIGGRGADRLDAGKGDDLLIGGYTVFDSDPAALALIMAEWTSERSYLDRVTNLRNATGPVLENTEVKLNAATVFDDTEKDRLDGGKGRDWYFANLDDDDDDDDKIKDRKSDELLN